MDPETWKRIERVFLEALERAPEERGAFLDEACAGDAALRREVEAELRALEEDPDFLAVPLADLSGLFRDEAGPEAGQARIGPYRLVRPLGRGGMGAVYLAVQEGKEFRRTVALKVLRQGLQPTDELLGRFRLERQILANLRHSNIAQLLDAGASEDGRPYFVMEYVDGERLGAYCDGRRLPLRRRLALFQAVCGAVQHAHQNLVVHRDLKPGNILVTAEGVPKLLDFGIGKVLEAGAEWAGAVETRTDVRVLTLEYAAPEQIRGDRITTATDVHALGVILYELLSGHHPFVDGGRTRQQVERAIVEADPPRPSEVAGLPLRRRADDGPDAVVSARELAAGRGTDPARLRRALRGDLDTIVLKALRKEPARRYPSAAALAEDIERYLDGAPVRARRDTLVYRTGKFVRRHAWSVGALAAVLIALSATTVATLVQSRRVARERDQALEVRSYLLEMFGATAPERATGDTVSVRRLLDLQANRTSSAYPDRPDLRAQMLEVLAEAYERLGLYDDAEPLAREALDLRRRTLGPGHPDVASALNMLGWVLHQKGRPDSAEVLLREAVALRREGGRRYAVELSRSLNDLGVVLERRGAYAEAQALYEEALAIRIDRLGPDHRSVGVTANNLATVRYQQGAFDRAVEAGERALRAVRAAFGSDHQRAVIAQGNLAVMKMAAEREMRDLLDRQQRLQGPEHPVTAAQMLNLAGVLNRRSSFAEAESLASEALRIRETTLGPDHADVAWSLVVLADAVVGQGGLEEALELDRRAHAILRQSLGGRHLYVGTVLAEIAEVHDALGSADSADARYAEALDIIEDAVGPDDPRAARIRDRIDGRSAHDPPPP